MFFIDFFGNRLLVAIIASLHVFINHPLAVGAYPLVTLMEWWGYRTKNPDWDNLAHKITFFLFVVATSVGALTGVGIWFSTALIAPFGIGSLLRVFFWAWFTEWIVFVSEVLLLWPIISSGKNGVRASLNAYWAGGIVIGFLLVYHGDYRGGVGIYDGFGDLAAGQSFLSAVFNPLYFPQFAFRTTYAFIVAGLCAWFFIFFFTKKGTDIRQKAVRFVARWILAWFVPFALASLWVLAKGSRRYESQSQCRAFDTAVHAMARDSGGDNVFRSGRHCLGGACRRRPAAYDWPGFSGSFALGLWLLGHFERVREFIRKPYVIADYMYSNGVKVADLPVYQRDGILAHAAFVDNRQITSENMLAAGRDVFLVACSRCHTTVGLNSVRTKVALYGNEPWDKNALPAFLATMHTSRTFMPPCFPEMIRRPEP